MSVTGIVLCGGRSTRMGRDKASQPFADETMLEHAIGIISEVSGEVIVVARPGALVLQLPVRVVHDPVADLGPLAGIAAGLSASHTDLNVVMACDMPLIRPAVLRRLMELRGDADICVAVADGHASPLCAVYRAQVAGIAQALLASGERRVMALLDRVQTKRVDGAAFRDLDPDLDSFVSCDTPEALRRAELKFRPAGSANSL